MTNTTNEFKTKVVTGKVRFSYVHADKPQAPPSGGDPKYSVSILIPKEDTVTINKIKAACKAAVTVGADKLKLINGQLPSTFKNPLRDGDSDRPGDAAYAGCYFINASSKRQPGMVDENRQPIIEAGKIYSGCYGRASINFFAFNTNGNKGVAAGLNNLQFLFDGEALGGGFSTPEEDFGEPEAPDATGQTSSGSIFD